MSEPSLRQIAMLLPGALLRALLGLIPAGISEALKVLCGLTLLVSPLALWIAWNQSVFIAILAADAVSILVFLSLLHFRED
jgi:hypothetical protein